MKIELEITRNAAIAGVVLIAGIVYAYLFVHNKVFPYSQVAPAGRDVVRYVRTIRMGRSGNHNAQARPVRERGFGYRKDPCPPMTALWRRGCAPFFQTPD